MPVGHFPLKDKLAVVTGGGSGINLAFVNLLLENGARGVLICDLTLTPEAESLTTSQPEKVSFMKCDVSNWRDLEAIPSKVEEAFGKDAVADIWIAGAGVFEPRWSSFIYDEEKDHYKVLQINTEHPIKLTRIAMRSLLGADKPGVVLIVASGAGVTGQYAAALYCASKHAVVGFTKSLGQADIDENVKVVCICPGMVKTPLWTGAAGRAVHDQFGYTDEACVSAEEVAEAMGEMVVDGKGVWPGGSLLSIRKGELRGKLESLTAFPNDGSEVWKGWSERCYKPIREVFGKERGGEGAKI